MENNAFSRPQRQSAKGILLITVVNFGKFLKAIWPLYLFVFFKQNEYQWLMMLALTALPFLFFAVISYFQYRNFSYFINTKTGEFVIRSGIINKKTISIEKIKIQEVNINQPFIHKVLNIFKLEIDTPGSDTKEVRVNAISYQNALDLKNYLLENRGSAVLTTDQTQLLSAPPPENKVSISIASLLKYGLTANYLKSFLAIIAFAFYMGKNAIEFLKEQSAEDFIVENRKAFAVALLENFSVLGIAGFICLIFLMGIVVNVILNLVMYFNMRITKNSSRLSLEYGLINTKHVIIAPHKVQMVIEIQNFIQKKINILHLKFRQVSGEEDHKELHNSIPGCSKTERNDFLKFIWKILPQYQYSLKPHPRTLIISSLIFVGIPIIISIFVHSIFKEYFWLILLYGVLAELMLIASFRNSRLYYNEYFLCLKSGIWDIEKKTVEYQKIQSIKVSQYIWQRKNDLGSVHFFTAGGKISFRSTRFSKIKKLVNYGLFKVESDQNHWM
ncbi:PH domain-containing protein [Chryseobacterium sp.]|uniref:PH domain-containing protein n=1 Tax=Chryseobacterium sp. TaxID=1871047 RepID=UPI001629FFAD|nr:PH domain-containing protein [Chryseobacterium sp.]